MVVIIIIDKYIHLEINNPNTKPKVQTTQVINHTNEQNYLILLIFF